MTQTYLSNEIWKDIPGYEDIYQASNYGRIRSIEGKTTYSRKHGVRHWKSRVLKPKVDNQFSKRVSLWKDGKHKDFLVHRLVAATFLGEPPKNYTVNHKDGNRLNNCIDNLEWISLADNIRHGFETGLYHTQKPVLVKIDGQSVVFRSMAQFDIFLKRKTGYTSNRLKKGKPIFNSDGHWFQVSMPF